MLAKKRLFVGVFTLLGLSLAMAAPPALHPVTGEPLIITCLRGTPAAIDGDLSDWNLAAMTPAVLDAQAQLYTGQTSWTGPEDCGGKFYVEWDDTNIYIAAVVTDDKLSMTKTSGDIWNADCVEVFIGTTELGTSASDHTQHYQFGFNANSQIWNWCNMDSAGQSLPNFMVASASRTPDGYICEVAIEHARISALEFKAGNILGFHPCIDDTEATDRELQITWTGREAHDQSLGFGYLILSNDVAIAKELSKAPNPAYGAVDVPVDAIMSWTAGVYAATHDVYFGTVFDDVNDASRSNPADVLVSQGQADTTYAPPSELEFGQTYYWRVDEVNGAPDNTIFKGDTWSFTTEPFSYPVTAVTATASSFQPGMGPQNTVNGSGLNENDQHSTESSDMWVSAGAQPDWIQFEFDKVYKLDKLRVWNSNQIIEGFVGFGAKDVAIEYSEDGQTWTALEGVPEFAQGTGDATYTANTAVEFGGVSAKFVKLTINSNWGGVTPTKSLSEVRFFYVPMQAFMPAPADGAGEVDLDAELTWRAGREAVSHEVFFGTDRDAVAAGGVAGEAVTGDSYTPDAMDFGTTYYWKVNEIGDSGTYEGDVWSFVAQEFAPIDDFEAYTDDEGNRIYQSWIDGLTTGASGSQVGYDTAPFAEKVKIHGGRQAMPLAYDNTQSPFYSEAELEFGSQQNWTKGGATELCLWTLGDGTAAATGMYVIVEDSTGKTAMATSATAATAADWTQWKIAMSDLAGVNFAKIAKLTIGVGNKTAPTAGGAGMVFIDDIGYGRSIAE